MKRKKSLFSIITVIIIMAVIIATFSGCFGSGSSSGGNLPNNNSNSFDNNSQSGESNDESGNASVDSNGNITNSDLANSCQKILCTAKDKNGDIYELVANVDETYQGSQLLVGAVKNGKWLIEPNNNCPYINRERWGWDKSGTDFDSLRCGYLSNGTFYNLKKGSTATPIDEGYLELWNVESNKYLYLEKATSKYTVGDYENLGEKQTDTFVFATSVGVGINDQITLKFLNTKTLEVTELYQVTTSYSLDLTQISEGLFYASIDMPNKIKIGTFYDKNGKKVFDLSEFETEETSISYVGNFKDGQCVIRNKLKNGTQYKIIIDKTGKMISQEKVS